MEEEAPAIDFSAHIEAAGVNVRQFFCLLFCCKFYDGYSG